MFRPCHSQLWNIFCSLVFKEWKHSWSLKETLKLLRDTKITLKVIVTFCCVLRLHKSADIVHSPHQEHTLTACVHRCSHVRFQKLTFASADKPVKGIDRIYVNCNSRKVTSVFSCVCPVIDHEFHQKLSKGYTDYLNNVITKFIVNNRKIIFFDNKLSNCPLLLVGVSHEL